MSKLVRVKQSFTLIELVLVIILVSSVSYLAFSKFNVNTEKKYKVTILNLKEFMLNNFEFNEELNFTCIEDEHIDCYVFIDKNINKNIKIENFFEQIPIVYNYDKQLSDYSFSRIRIDDNNYMPIFELIINKDRKHKNLVIDTLDDNVYIVKSISAKPAIFENTNAVLDKFFTDEAEVKDAL